MEKKEKIAAMTLDEGSILRRSPEVEHERMIALTDLLTDNAFAPIGLNQGPYHVHLAVKENRLIMDVTPRESARNHQVTLPLQPLRGIIRDYFLVCESYYEALKTPTPCKIEAVDMGRRSIHNEGSEQLQSLLWDKVEVDFPTARRLFTLICVLHIK